MLDLALVNAHILYNATNEAKKTQLKFRVAVAEGLLQDYERLVHDTTLPHRLLSPFVYQSMLFQSQFQRTLHLVAGRSVKLVEHKKETLTNTVHVQTVPCALASLPLL